MRRTHQSSFTVPFLLAAAVVTHGAVFAEDAAKSPDISELVAQLGHDEHEMREDATQALAALGEKAKAQLQKAAKETKDPEIQKRAKELLLAIARKEAWKTLSEEERAIADLPYQNENGSSPNQLTIHARGHGTFTLIDAGLTRLAIRDQAFNGSSTMSVSMGSGRSSGQAGSLTVSSSGGQARCNFRSIKFTITGSEFKIDHKSLAIDGGKRIVFVSKSGKLEKHAALPSAKQESEATAEKK